jgi:signal transduction histidine kinase
MHIDVSMFPITDAHGMLTSVVCQWVDITDQKKAEAELQFKNIILSTEQEVTLDGILIVDENMRILMYNRRFIEMWGIPPKYVEDGIDDPVLQFVTSQVADSETFRKRVLHLYEHREEASRDEIILADGRTFDRYSAPMFGSDKQYYGRVWFFRDITDHLRLAAQFQQSQKMESVGRLAGGVAHDFNNMLSVILGYGEMLLDKLHSGDPLREDIKEIVSAARRSSVLTRQLLAFARKQTLQPEVLHLNDIVRHFDNMLRRIIGEDIDLQLALAEDVGYVLVDRGQIEQVITNLVINARDAMPKGGKLIIETAAVEIDGTFAEFHPGNEPGTYAMLAMSDTGCGMDKELLSQIFEPFFTTKEMGRGTGLGLSSVYGIIRQSNGNIRVYSVPGKGTTFKIYLPVTDLKPGLSTITDKEPNARGAGQQILVVDDELSLRNLLETSLSRLGYKVTAAANGGEALLMVEERGFNPDLIISDVVMPNMSGRELVDRLRMNRPDLKVLYMSGYTDRVIADHGILDPQTPFIQKPFTIRDVSRKVRELLEIQ